MPEKTIETAPLKTIETELLNGMFVVDLPGDEEIGFMDPAPLLDYADELDALL